MKHPTRFALISHLSAALLVWFGVWYPGGGYTLSMQTNWMAIPQFRALRAYLEDVSGATAARYHATDSAGHTMDTAKIIADPAGGYLAVYHTNAGPYFEVHLAHSTDLLHWDYLQSYGPHTHQPFLAVAPNGGFVLANETDKGYNWILVRYYPSRADLLANRPARTFNVPHTLTPSNHFAEGTPNIYSITLSPDIDHSVIDIGFHYFRDGIVDRQARGTLVNFNSWTAQAQPDLDAPLLESGIHGNVGDRDQAIFQGRAFLLYEGQYTAGDFSSWRVFLRDEASQATAQLQVRTAGGERQAVANPSFTILPSPHGGQCVVVTYFLPGSGELIFYHDLPGEDLIG